MPRIIWSIKFWHYHTVSGHWSLRKHTKHQWLYPKGRKFYYFSRSKSAKGKSKVKPSNSHICKLYNVYMGLKFKCLQGYHNNVYHLIRWIWKQIGFVVSKSMLEIALRYSKHITSHSVKLCRYAYPISHSSLGLWTN